MMGGRETLPSGNGATGDTGAASASPFAWGEGFMDLVAKYERNSERQLYVYGISVSRCASCRHKLKSDATECDNCRHAVPTKSQACMRCKGPKPGLWCFECDAYFCGPCHSAPHVLVLNGSAPEKHNCFPVDGSSGKLIFNGAWSSSLLALAKTARRSQMKLREDGAQAEQAKRSAEDATLSASMESLRADEKTRSVDKERKQAAKETARRMIGSSRPPPVPASSSRQPNVASASNHSQSASSSVRSRSPSPGPSGARPHPKAKASPSPSLTKQSSATPTPVRPSIVGEVSSAASTLSTSRKRKSPTADVLEGPDQSSSAPPAQQRPTPIRSSAAPDSVPSAAAEPFDGMSLHARLLQMKNKQFQRSHSGTASPGTTATSESATTPTPLNLSPAQLVPVAAPQPTRPPAQPSFPLAPVQNQYSQPATTTIPAAAVTSAAATPTAQTPSIKVDHTLDEVMSRPIESPAAPLVGVPAGVQAASSTGPSTGLSASFTDSGLLYESDNALVDAVVTEFEKRNAHAAMVEGKLQLLNEAVRKASVMDLGKAAAIDARAEQYRNALRIAYEHRERALANVILFSPEIHAYARSLTADKLLDIPQVISLCYQKCAELAHKTREAEAKLPELREAIHRAVSSSDTDQLLALGNSIAAIEEQIREHKNDRVKQFHAMFQVSKKLRETIHNAVKRMKQESPSGTS